jgi:hypothetical protein
MSKNLLLSAATNVLSVLSPCADCQASVMLGEAKVHLDNAIGALGQAMRK